VSVAVAVAEAGVAFEGAALARTDPRGVVDAATARFTAAEVGLVGPVADHETNLWTA
jgi:hypothetical protein